MSEQKPVRKQVHVMRQAIRWGDMDAFGHVNNTVYFHVTEIDGVVDVSERIHVAPADAFGHVNNTVYFRYMETARIAFLEEAVGHLDIEGEGPVIVTAYCSFAKQLKYPGDIEVRTFAGAPGRSSVEITHEIRLVDADGAADTVYAEGGAKVVWVDFAAEKSRPLPDRMRRLLPAA